MKFSWWTNRLSKVFILVSKINKYRKACENDLVPEKLGIHMGCPGKDTEDSFLICENCSPVFDPIIKNS